MLFSRPQIPDFAWLLLQTDFADRALGQNTWALFQAHKPNQKKKENKETNKKPRLFFTSSKKNTKNSRPLSLHTQCQRTERKRSESKYQTCHILCEPLRGFRSVPATPAGDTQTTRLRGKQGRFVPKRGALSTQLHNAPQNGGRERADGPFLLPQPTALDKFA